MEDEEGPDGLMLPRSNAPKGTGYLGVKIIHGKFLDADPFSQENILETVSFACKYE